jgi:hypothetical protein
MSREAEEGNGSEPWYRHRWPWFLMLGPFVVLIAGVVTIYLAVISNDGLVDEDYYALGISVNQTTAHERNAQALGLEAELLQGEAETASKEARLRVLLRSDAATPLPQALSLRVKHPTRPGVDQSVTLSADGAGSYTGLLKRRLAGRWHVVLEDAGQTWRLTGDWVIEDDPVLHLSARRADDTNPSYAAP